PRGETKRTMGDADLPAHLARLISPRTRSLRFPPRPTATTPAANHFLSPNPQRVNPLTRLRRTTGSSARAARRPPPIGPQAHHPIEPASLPCPLSRVSSAREGAKLLSLISSHSPLVAEHEPLSRFG